MIGKGTTIQELSQKADILLVTATEVETKAVLHVFSKAGKDVTEALIQNKIYYDFGIIGGAKTYMAQSSEVGMGNLLSLLESFKVLSPSVLIIVGIAFGISSKEQNIGDILVSQQLADFAFQRINTTSEDRLRAIRSMGSSKASTRLLNRFQTGLLDWQGPKVQFGLLLSGPRLTDNQNYRNQLLEIEQNAIGGEMEGTGLYAAAQRYGIDWVVVKAICSWADGNTPRDQNIQQEAAFNAASFTLHVLQHGGLTQTTNEPSFFSQSNVSFYTSTLGTTFQTYGEHSGLVLSVSWEPKGSRIASAGEEGRVHIWNADTGQTLLTYYRDLGQSIGVKFVPTVYKVAWSPNSKFIASSGDGKTVQVWDANTGLRFISYSGHSGIWPSVYALDWSPDGRRIASACSSAGIDRTAHIWEVQTGKTLLRYRTPLGLSPTFSVLAIAWSPDGSRIAMTCTNLTIRIWDAATGITVKTFPTPSPWTGHLAWSPDSKFLAIANPDGTVHIRDTYTDQLLCTYIGHSDSVRAVAWSPNGTTIASASNDKTVQLWNATTGETIFKYSRHFDWTTDVVWSPNGTLIASASNDKTVHIWQAK